MPDAHVLGGPRAHHGRLPCPRERQERHPRADDEECDAGRPGELSEGHAPGGLENDRGDGGRGDADRIGRDQPSPVAPFPEVAALQRRLRARGDRVREDIQKWARRSWASEERSGHSSGARRRRFDRGRLQAAVHRAHDDASLADMYIPRSPHDGTPSRPFHPSAQIRPGCRVLGSLDSGSNSPCALQMYCGSPSIGRLWPRKLDRT